MKLPGILLVVFAGVALLAAACGNDTATGTDGSGDVRSIDVDMVDNAFEPAHLEVSKGETVRFEFTNHGQVAHDAFIGDTGAQTDHAAEMPDAQHQGGHGDHGAAGAVTVEPGDSAELTHTFDDAGTIEIGCHQPGHYDAGMKVDVEVA